MILLDDMICLMTLSEKLGFIEVDDCFYRYAIQAPINVRRNHKMKILLK